MMRSKRFERSVDDFGQVARRRRCHVRHSPVATWNYWLGTRKNTWRHGRSIHPAAATVSFIPDYSHMQRKAARSSVQLKFTSISRGVLLGLGEFAAAAFLMGNSGTIGLAEPSDPCPRGSSAARSLEYLRFHRMKRIKEKRRLVHFNGGPPVFIAKKATLLSAPFEAQQQNE